jgi:hypothetical protein
VGTYAATADVQRRNPYRVIGVSTSPSSTDVDEFISEAEASLHGALAAAQIPTPITDANGSRLLKAWVLNYAEGRVRMAYAAAGGDGANSDGRDLVDGFWARVNDIIDNPTRYASMLFSGSAPSGTRRVRCYQLDNQDSKSIGNDDFAPVFTKADPETQF